MLLQQSDTCKIIGICMEVHAEPGYGFSETVYKDATEVEASLIGYPTHREKQYKITYKGKSLGHTYFADFVKFDNIIVEVKSCRDGIANDHISQTLHI